VELLEKEIEISLFVVVTFDLKDADASD